jgi:hypothetical protein
MIRYLMVERDCNEKTCGACSDRRYMVEDEEDECLLFGSPLAMSWNGAIRLDECLRAEKALLKKEGGEE